MTTVKQIKKKTYDATKKKTNNARKKKILKVVGGDVLGEGSYAKVFTARNEKDIREIFDNVGIQFPGIETIQCTFNGKKQKPLNECFSTVSKMALKYFKDSKQYEIEKKILNNVCSWFTKKKKLHCLPLILDESSSAITTVTFKMGSESIDMIAYKTCDGDLYHLSKQKLKLTTKQFLDLLEHVVEFLLVLNDFDMHHMDIKPANILYVVENGVMKFYLSDYGLISSKSNLGTEFYMSPLWETYKTAPQGMKVHIENTINYIKPFKYNLFREGEAKFIKSLADEYIFKQEVYSVNKSLQKNDLYCLGVTIMELIQKDIIHYNQSKEWMKDLIYDLLFIGNRTRETDAFNKLKQRFFKSNTSQYPPKDSRINTIQELKNRIDELRANQTVVSNSNVYGKEDETNTQLPTNEQNSAFLNNVKQEQLKRNIPILPSIPPEKYEIPSYPNTKMNTNTKSNANLNANNNKSNANVNANTTKSNANFNANKNKLNANLNANKNISNANLNANSNKHGELHNNLDIIGGKKRTNKKK